MNGTSTKLFQLIHLRFFPDYVMVLNDFSVRIMKYKMNKQVFNHIELLLAPKGDTI